MQRIYSNYGNQFQRVVPWMLTVDMVAEPLRRVGGDADRAEARTGEPLRRVRSAETL